MWDLEIVLLMLLEKQHLIVEKWFILGGLELQIKKFGARALAVTPLLQYVGSFDAVKTKLA